MPHSPPERLSEEQLREGLEKLKGWTVKEGKLFREYIFKDFITAFSWMSACALVAEKLDHHPDWSNVWSKVEVRLWTHESGGITELDLKLAKKMEKLAQKLID